MELRIRPARRAHGAPLTALCLCLSLLLGVAAAPAAVPEVDDGDVARAIEADLWSDPLVDANTVDVLVRDGVVNFTGATDTLLARDRAEEIAENIVGVSAIVNRIQVAGGPRDDDALAQAVKDALLRDPATDSYQVQVSASKGTVTLRGEVDSWAEKKLSGDVARGVRGVREVLNQIEIRYVSERPDFEILEEVKAQLANDVAVDDFGVQVAVEDGRVTLAGRVGSLAEKRRARTDAWVAGVRAVDDSDLRVEWWARDEMRRKSLFQNRPDEEVEKAVRQAFVYDPRVHSFNPDVHVSNGIVTLSGVVDNAAAKRAAEDDARNVVGVWRVRNHLKVRPDTIPADEILEKRVESALADDEHVDRWNVDVDAYAGMVYLSGAVKNSFEKERAERRASRVNGVVHVVNNLEYDYEWTWKPDWEIRAEVNDQLYWSPFVDADEVKVSVENGVVTLTGEVDTWAERADAAKNAWEGGAKDVRNQLSVVYEVYGPLAGVSPVVP